VPAHANDLVKPCHTRRDDRLVEEILEGDVQAVKGDGYGDREEGPEQEAYRGEQTIAEMYSTDILFFDQANRLEQGIGHEPEEMLSRLAQDDFGYGMMVTKIFDQVVAVCFKAADLRGVVSTDEQDRRFQHLFPFASLEAHLADLLRHQAHHKDNDGGGEKQGAHVRKAAPDSIGVKIVEKPRAKKKGAHWEEDPQGRIESAYFENDHEKTNTVSHELDIALPFLSGFSTDVHVLDAFSTSQDTQGDGGRIGIGIGKKI
jgi:hypothetical protein